MSRIVVPRRHTLPACWRRFSMQSDRHGLAGRIRETAAVPLGVAAGMLTAAGWTLWLALGKLGYVLSVLESQVGWGGGLF